MVNEETFMEKSKVIHSAAKALILTLLILLAFLLNATFSWHWEDFGLRPRTPEGAWGIVTMPFLHGDMDHLFSNLVPLFLLAFGVFYYFPGKALAIIILLTLSTGILTWSIGQGGNHIGASGLVYALAFFLVAISLLKREPSMLSFTLIIIFLYGSMIWGFFPRLFPDKHISWEGHLSGALSGIAAAIIYRKEGPEKRDYFPEDEEDDVEDDAEEIRANSSTFAAQKESMPLMTDEIKSERALLVGVATAATPFDKVNDYLDELAFLVETAGGIPVKKFIQNLPYPDPRTYLGSGKLDEAARYIEENNIDLAVFDDELSPSQTRNIEAVLKCTVLDRTRLILDIFAKRAQTAHAKTQVELAQYQYLLPRLTRMWTHLEKQRGGIGMRGPGEKEIETDRRIIRDRISLLKEKLKEIDRQKSTQRGNRGEFIRVALVGYTNVGKSTIMNLISKSEVFAENKLFATLDTTVRKVVIDNLPFLLSDTVGFIRKLPTGLVESFKSTLDEIRETDLLLHVVDISHPDFEEQIEVVHKTLEEIQAGHKPVIMVFNKIDNYTWTEKDADDLTPKERCNITLEELKQTWMAQANTQTIFISAKNRENIDAFRGRLYEEVKKLHTRIYPYNNFLY